AESVPSDRSGPRRHAAAPVAHAGRLSLHADQVAGDLPLAVSRAAGGMREGPDGARGARAVKEQTQAMRHLKSLREFLDALTEIGDVQPIETEVDWRLEMGAITRRSMDL